MIDKRGLLPLAPGARVDVGCGARKCSPAHVGIDALDSDAADIVGDVLEVLASVATGTLAEVHSAHFLEHVDDLEAVVAEMSRVLMPGGRLIAVVPHFSNAYFYSDPTHKRPFGLYTFGYLGVEHGLRRQVPSYGVQLPLRLERVDLVFKSTRPFYVRHAIRRAVGLLANRTRWTREFYEENCTGLVSCYELRFELVRT